MRVLWLSVLSYFALPASLALIPSIIPGADHFGSQTATKTRYGANSRPSAALLAHEGRYKGEGHGQRIRKRDAAAALVSSTAFAFLFPGPAAAIDQAAPPMERQIDSFSESLELPAEVEAPADQGQAAPMIQGEEDLDSIEDPDADLFMAPAPAPTLRDKVSDRLSMLADSASSSPVAAGAIAITGVGGLVAGRAYIRDKNDKAEQERLANFRRIMGVDSTPPRDSISEPSKPDSAVADDTSSITDLGDLLDSPLEERVGSSSIPAVAPSTPSPAPVAARAVVPQVPPAKPAPKKNRFGLGIKKNKNQRETNLSVLIGTSPDISTLTGMEKFGRTLAGFLTFGAVGRFPHVEVFLESVEVPPSFDLESARSRLTELRDQVGMTNLLAAEAFANVVNCMIIELIDLASSSLKEKDDKIVVAALNVVLDFMDHAGALYDAVAGEVVINPVVYQGSLGKSKLEQMYGKYLGTNLMGMDEESTERSDRLQAVFEIKEGKAQGIQQKLMMKTMMKLMKSGGKGVEGMEGMEGLADMMKEMGGADGMDFEAMMKNMENGGDMPAPSPEELKESIKMMKQLVDNKMVSPDELEKVKQEFRNSMGADIEELIKMAEEQEKLGELDDDGRELLSLFKEVLA